MTTEHPTQASEVQANLETGDVIELPQYETPLKVTYTGELDGKENAMVGLEFQGRNGAEKSLMRNKHSGRVYLMAGSQDKGEVTEITVLESDRDAGNSDDGSEDADVIDEMEEGDTVALSSVQSEFTVQQIVEDRDLPVAGENNFKADTFAILNPEGGRVNKRYVVRNLIGDIHVWRAKGGSYGAASSSAKADVTVEIVEEASSETEADSPDQNAEKGKDTQADDEQPDESERGQTELGAFTEDSKPAVTDGGEVSPDKEDGEDEGDDPHFDPDAETVSEAWEGVFISASWGYGQTNVDFAQIIEVSDSGKTVKAKLTRADVSERVNGSEQVRPNAETYGDTFRLHVRNVGGDPGFRGSYPFIDGDMENETHRETFLPFSNEAGAAVHQTPANQGH